MNTPLRVVAGAIVHDGRVLAARRGPRMSSPGVWELPGGKVERGECDEAALCRELDEELGVRVAVGRRLGAVRVDVPRPLVLIGFQCRLLDGAPVAREHAEIRWVLPESFGELAWAAPDLPLLAALRPLLLDHP